MIPSDQSAPDRHAAEGVLQQAFDAYATMRWDSVATLVHPEAIARFHRTMIEHQRHQEQFRARPPAGRHSPDMPPEVRAWFEAQQRRHEEQLPSGVAEDFAGVLSLEVLEALSPQEAYARYLEGHDARAQLLRHQGASGTEPLVEEVRFADLSPRNRVLGSVAEDEATVHVLYRKRLPGVAGNMGEGEPTILAVATMRASVDGWRLWTTGRDADLFGWSNWVMSIESDEERGQRLQAASEQVFTWPEGETPRIKAQVQGYPGGALAPDGVRLEEILPDGSRGRVTVPHRALQPLSEYLEPWLSASGD